MEPLRAGGQGCAAGVGARRDSKVVRVIAQDSGNDVVSDAVRVLESVAAIAAEVVC